MITEHERKRRLGLISSLGDERILDCSEPGFTWEPERGFYWLKTKERNRTVRNPDPKVAWFDGDHWYFPGTDFSFDPTDEEDREVLDRHVIIGRAEPPTP